MASKKPSLYPQQINSNVWYYESPRKLHFHIDVMPGERRVINFYVPASTIERSLERMSPPPKKRREP